MIKNMLNLTYLPLLLVSHMQPPKFNAIDFEIYLPAFNFFLTNTDFTFILP